MKKSFAILFILIGLFNLGAGIYAYTQASNTVLVYILLGLFSIGLSWFLLRSK